MYVVSSIFLDVTELNLKNNVDFMYLYLYIFLCYTESGKDDDMQRHNNTKKKINERKKGN